MIEEVELKGALVKSPTKSRIQIKYDKFGKEKKLIIEVKEHEVYQLLHVLSNQIMVANGK
jgi:hypothetical protein